MFIVDCVLYGFCDGLVETISQALPLGGYTAIICIELTPVISACIVAFVGGAVFFVNPKTIRLAAVTYIIVGWLWVIIYVVLMSLQVTKSFSFFTKTVAISSVFNIIILVAVFFLSKWACLSGRKVGEKIRKRPVPNQ